MDEIANAPLPIEFGSFKVLRSRKLVVAGRTIGLGSRAFDIITALIEARGTLISKEELIRRAWPRTIVDESNLHTQIAALRKALGKNRDAIKNDSGRGYRLVDIGAVKAEKIQESPVQDLSQLATSLPALVSTLTGRDFELSKLRRAPGVMEWCRRYHRMARSASVFDNHKTGLRHDVCFATEGKY